MKNLITKINYIKKEILSLRRFVFNKFFRTMCINLKSFKKKNFEKKYHWIIVQRECRLKITGSLNVKLLFEKKEIAC